MKDFSLFIIYVDTQLKNCEKLNIKIYLSYSDKQWKHWKKKL